MSRVTIASVLVRALGLTLALTFTSEASAFEVKHTKAGELVKWHHPSVAWTLDRSLHQVDGAGEAAVAAAAAWTERGGAPALSIASRDAQVEPGFDRISAIIYAKEGFAPAGTALAVTLLSFDDRTGEVLDADIVLNGKYHFAPMAAGTTPSEGAPRGAADPYDVKRILAHELGHALGLSDELSRSDALMYPYVPRDVMLPASPGDDDVAGLTTLYAAEPNGRQTTSAVVNVADDGGGASAGCAVVATPASRSSTTIYVTIGLALAALAAARAARGNRRGAAACTAIAAAALVVLPPMPSSASRDDAFDATAVVTRVTTTALHGVFRSEVELSTTACASHDCPGISHAIVWGGTIDGVTQVVGGERVPQAGAHVAIDLEPARPAGVDGVVRSMTRIGR